MVASLQDTSLEEECFTQALQHQQQHHQQRQEQQQQQQQQQDGRNTADALPLGHEAAKKWFYKDPQGEIQGMNPRLVLHSHRSRGSLQPRSRGGVWSSTKNQWPNVGPGTVDGRAERFQEKI